MRSERNLVFVSETGKKLMYPASYLDSSLYSLDGQSFYELLERGSSGRSFGNEIDETKHFSVPQLDLDGEAHRVNETITFLGETFVLTGQEFGTRDTFIVSLPTDRQPEYLCVSNDGTLVVYVSASKHKYSYESFRLFVGNGESMREVPIVGLPTRYRDGGTTYIDTTEGRFFSPSPFNKGPHNEPLPCTWDGAELISIGRNEAEKLYDIVEDDKGAVISVTKK